MSHNIKAEGKVIYTLGNLIKVQFTGDIAQGEVGFLQLESESLKAEVIEIDGNIAKMQVFEDTRGLKYGNHVLFTEELLCIELGPGLLAEVFDGLQNPLEKVADVCGLFLQRGTYIEPLDRVRHWEFRPIASVGDELERGDDLGSVLESQFIHKIMLPFSMYGKYKLTWIINPGSYPVDKVIAKVIDEKGHELELTMVQKWPVKKPLIQGERVKATKPLTTGMRIIDTMFPVVKGMCACNPGPFGAGKTVTQQCIAKYSNVDIVVLAACGERAGEVVETLKTFPTLMDVHSNQPLMNRTVIICNTSSMPVAAREASVYVGMTIAEYYRQMGLDVLLLADSTSRWAQAMREMSGRLEEIPGEEAFPAYLGSRISSFYERSGAVRLKDGEVGSVSTLGAVSPAGGNMSEPVTQNTMNVVGAFICLSREYSDMRRYPAIDPLKSWSKYAAIVGETYKEEVPSWYNWVLRAQKLIAEGDEIGRRMEVVGQEGISISDMIKYCKSELFSFCYLQQNAFDPEDAYCSMEQQKVQFALMNEIFDTEFPFNEVDEVKEYFLKLQGNIKNLNHMKFQSDLYEKALAQIEKELEEVVKRKEVTV
jgi:V/A-type H+-transporting ATPase subunit A